MDIWLSILKHNMSILHPEGKVIAPLVHLSQITANKRDESEVDEIT